MLEVSSSQTTILEQLQQMQDLNFAAVAIAMHQASSHADNDSTPVTKVEKSDKKDLDQYQQPQVSLNNDAIALKTSKIMAMPEAARTELLQNCGLSVEKIAEVNKVAAEVQFTYGRSAANIYALIAEFMNQSGKSNLSEEMAGVSAVQAKDSTMNVINQNLADNIGSMDASRTKLQNEIEAEKNAESSPLAKFLHTWLPVILSVISVVVAVTVIGGAAAAAIDASAAAATAATDGAVTAAAEGTAEGVVNAASTAATEGVSSAADAATTGVAEIVAEGAADAAPETIEESVASAAERASTEVTEDVEKNMFQKILDKAKDMVTNFFKNFKAFFSREAWNALASKGTGATLGAIGKGIAYGGAAAGLAWASHQFGPAIAVAALAPSSEEVKSTSELVQKESVAVNVLQMQSTELNNDVNTITTMQITASQQNALASADIQRQIAEQMVQAFRI